LNRRVNRALLSTFNQFNELSEDYFKAANEYQFAYGERSVRYVIAQSLSQANMNVFVEQPIKRQNGSQGWLDFWVNDPKTGDVYLIEYKHHQRKRRATATTTVSRAYSEAISQARDIQPDQYNLLDMKTRNLYRVALVTVHVYQSGWNLVKSGNEMSREESIAHAATIIDSFKITPTFVSCWLLDDQQQESSGTPPNRVRSHAILAFGYSERVSR